MKKISYLYSAILLAGTSFQSFGSALYIGHTRTEQDATLTNQAVEFKPVGQNVLLALDLNSNWSVSFDYAQQDDQASVNHNIVATSDSKSWGASLGYYWQDWSVSVAYGKWEDTQSLNDPNPGNLYQRTTDTPSYSINLTRTWLSQHWFYGMSLSANYNDWDQKNQLRPARNRPPQNTTEQGNSSFISLNLLLNRRYELENNQALTLGGNLGWNQKLNSTSQLSTHNGRPVNPRRQTSANHRLNVSAVTGSDSYGFISGFISYDVNPHWFVELGLSSDFSTDNNQRQWTVELGYLF